MKTRNSRTPSGITTVAATSHDPLKYRRNSNRAKKYHSGRGACSNSGSAGISREAPANLANAAITPSTAVKTIMFRTVWYGQ